jgi:hypothetical protein
MNRQDERRETIITLLRTLRDAGETLQRGDEGGAFNPDSRVLTMPAVFHVGSYRELLAALLELRAAGPRHYWHVSERYIRSERLTRDLINRAGRYFEATKITTHPVDGEPFVRWSIEAPLAKNMEVLQAVAQPKVPVLRKPGDPRMVLVHATVERWDAKVERRPLETGIDFLSSRLPQRLVIPRDVLAAA